MGLGELTGFGVVHPLPGIWDGLTVNTAITLPVGVEAYAAYALRVWLGAHPDVRDSLAVRFARGSAVGALALGMAGQVAYHLMIAYGVTHAPWWITTIVACLPVVVLGMGATLVHLMHAAHAEASSLLTAAYAEVDEAHAETARAQAEAARARTEVASVRADLESVRALAEAERGAVRAVACAHGVDVQAVRTPRTKPARARTGPVDDLGVRRRVRDQWAVREAAGRRTPARALARTLGIGEAAARAQVSRWRAEQARAEAQ